MNKTAFEKLRPGDVVQFGPSYGDALAMRFGVLVDTNGKDFAIDVHGRDGLWTERIFLPSPESSTDVEFVGRAYWIERNGA